MPFKKGRKKTGGRKKGSPNKLPVAAKQAMMEAFAELGGVQTLVRWARSKKPARGLSEFYKLWSKTLPREISGPDGGPIPFADMTDEAVAAEIARLRGVCPPAAAGAGGRAAAGGPDLPGVAR